MKIKNIKGLFIGDTIGGLRHCFKKRHIRIRQLYDTDRITVPFPFCGYLYYGDEKINIYDYSFAFFTESTRICKYLYTIIHKLVPTFCNPYIRSIFADKVQTSLILSEAVCQKYINCDNTDERWIIVDGETVCAKRRHALVPGEFRTHDRYGGHSDPLPVTQDMKDLGKRVYDCFPGSV